MKTVETSMDVHVPLSKAYNQWTQFEQFPMFMRHVEDIKQLDDRQLRWRIRVGSKTREWESEIVEQIPDKRIAWRATRGARHAGVVAFYKLDDSSCRLMLQLEYDPEGFTEKLASLMGAPRKEIETDLKNFAQFIENRVSETGAWRGRIPSNGEATP